MSATAATGSAQHWGRLWGSRPGDWAATEEQQIQTYERAIREVGIEPGERVLDVGCGSGVFLRAAADRGAEVFGLDASEALLEIARRRVPGAELRCGEMQSLPYDSGSFDLVAGFNSFFFAADMVAALREAGRVARGRAPVLIQVWGAPERCALDAMRAALRRFLPPEPEAPQPPALWKPGVLEELAAQADLAPESTFDYAWAFEFEDERALGRAMLAPGIAAGAAEEHGEDEVRTAIVDSLAPYRTGDGGYRLENEWHYLVCRAP